MPIKDGNKLFSVMIPQEMYDALIEDGKENERTMSQTIRWGLKQYLEMKEMTKNRPRVVYNGPGVRHYQNASDAYTKATADADEIKEMLDTNEI